MDDFELALQANMILYSFANRPHVIQVGLQHGCADFVDADLDRYLAADGVMPVGCSHLMISTSGPPRFACY